MLDIDDGLIFEYKNRPVCNFPVDLGHCDSNDSTNKFQNRHVQSTKNILKIEL